jgi:hypothetical protein
VAPQWDSPSAERPQVAAQWDGPSAERRQVPSYDPPSYDSPAGDEWQVLPSYGSSAFDAPTSERRQVPVPSYEADYDRSPQYGADWPDQYASQRPGPSEEDWAERRLSPYAGRYPVVSQEPEYEYDDYPGDDTPTLVNLDSQRSMRRGPKRSTETPPTRRTPKKGSGSKREHDDVTDEGYWRVLRGEAG